MSKKKPIKRLDECFLDYGEAKLWFKLRHSGEERIPVSQEVLKITKFRLISYLKFLATEIYLLQLEKKSFLYRPLNLCVRMPSLLLQQMNRRFVGTATSWFRRTISAATVACSCTCSAHLGMRLQIIAALIMGKEGHLLQVQERNRAHSRHPPTMFPLPGALCLLRTQTFAVKICAPNLPCMVPRAIGSPPAAKTTL